MSTATKNESTKQKGTKTDEKGTAAPKGKASARIAAPLKTALGAALATLDTAVAGEASARVAVGYARVAVGAALLPISKHLLALDGWTAGDVQKHVMSSYLKGKTDADGREYAWSTVEAWIDAAATEDTLTPEQRGKFNSDSLRVIRRLKQGEKGDYTARRKFAADLLKQNKVTVSAVRAEYDAKHGTKGKGKGNGEKSSLDLAKTIEAEFSKVAGVHRGSLKRQNLSYNTIAGVALFAATIGQKFPKVAPDALSMALASMLTAKS